MARERRAVRVRRAFGRAARLLCPRCGAGPMFHGWFRMAPACAACGLRFERAQGYFVGAIFVCCQAYEWSKLIHEGLHINGNPWGASLFGTSFFLITGFHGLHVTGGVIYLVSIIRYVTNRPSPAASYNAVEITGLYWHFVDLVWIMVFTFMYLI